MTVSRLKAIARHAIYSRATAILTGEIPEKDGASLFLNPISWLKEQRFAKVWQRDRYGWRRYVHMTAPDGAVARSHYSELQAFILRNPDYQFFFWDDSACDLFMRNFFLNKDIFDIYDNSRYGIVRADIFRLCVLKELGGIYLDYKSNAKASLSQLSFDDGKGYLLQTEGKIQEPEVMANLRLPAAKLLTNWFLAFPPDHWFLGRALDEIVKGPPFGVDERSFREWVWAFTGPRMITRVANAHWRPGIDVELLSSENSTLGLVYACKGSWVRALIHPHYASKTYR